MPGAVIHDPAASQAGHHLSSRASRGHGDGTSRWMPDWPAVTTQVAPGAIGWVRATVHVGQDHSPCQWSRCDFVRSLRTRIVVRSPVRNRKAGPSSAPL